MGQTVYTNKNLKNNVEFLDGSSYIHDIDTKILYVL